MPDVGENPASQERLPWVIRMDIPSIDGMFSISGQEVKEVRGGIGLAGLGTSISVAVVGPHGTGKSVLAVHLAARYLADCHAAFADRPEAMPRVCYISTDMTLHVAEPSPEM